MRTKISGLTFAVAASLLMSVQSSNAKDAVSSGHNTEATVASNESIGNVVESTINETPAAIELTPCSLGSAVTLQVPATIAEPPLVAKVAKVETAKKPKKGFNSFLRRMLEPVTDLQSQSLKLQEQIVKLEQPIENLQPPMWKLQERVLSVEGQLSEVQKNLGGVRDELKSVHGTISGVRTQITRLEQPIGALQNPVARLYEPISALGTPIDNLHVQLNQLSHQMTSLQAPVSSLNAPILALNAPVSQLVTPVKELHEPLTKLQAELGDLKLELSDLKRSINRIGVYLLVAISLTGLFAAIGIPVAIFLAWGLFSRRVAGTLFPHKQQQQQQHQQPDYQRLEKDLAATSTKQ